MAVKTWVGIEDYLGMSFEHDREFVHGEIVERSIPTFSHAEIQAALIAALRRYRTSHNLHPGPEVRLRMSDDLVRIPDLSVFEGRPEEVPTTPPLIVAEIASPDDRLQKTLEKLAEYRQWGVRHVWLVEPELKALFTYDGSLNQVTGFEIAEHGICVTAAEIFG